MSDFTPDARLAEDSHHVTDLPLCQLRLMNDSRFAWLVLVPRRADVSEVTDLDETDQRQLWHEATWSGGLLKQCLSGDKLNIATLGNVVAQLHLHIILRRHDDAAWPAPVWGLGEAEPYDDDALANLSDHLQHAIETADRQP